jgi:hypothetical protein
MNWKIGTALLLLLPIYWWMVCVLPPVGAVEFATHMTEAGEHCSSFCEHSSSLIAFPQPVSMASVQADKGPASQQVLALLAPLTVMDEHPPPQFCSIAHSLRAPPSPTGI